MYRGFWYAEALEFEGALSLPLQGDITADVCIVGAGYLGLWSAIRLKQADRSLDVVLIEQDRCGSGASGRNGGLANNWWAKYLSLMELCGADEARRICQAAASAVDEIGDFCLAQQIDAQYRKDGWLWLASNARQDKSWLVLTEQLDKLGVNPFQPQSAQQAREKSGSGRVLGGIFDPNAATVQPALLARGLRRAALQLGIKIYEKTPLTRLQRSTPPVLQTPQGNIKAQKVVLAMNAWGAQFAELRRMIVVMSSDMIATVPIKQRLDATGFKDGVCLTDSRTVLNYWRNTPSGRIVFGKPLGQFAFASKIGQLYEKPCPAASAIAKEMRSFYPQLADVPVISSWSGPLDRSMKGLPHFGYLGGHRDIVFGIGFSGNGVATTVFASRIIKSLLHEAEDEWSQCALVGQKIKRLPMEPFRFFGARLVRNALLRKESLEDENRSAGAVTNFLAALAPAGYVPKKANKP